MSTSLEQELQHKALCPGADSYGIADLSGVKELIRQQGGEMMAQYALSLSVGVATPFAIVDQLPRHQDKAVALAYSTHGYDILNDRLDQIGSHAWCKARDTGPSRFGPLKPRIGRNS